jgi:hypothetical protein
MLDHPKGVIPTGARSAKWRAPHAFCQNNLDAFWKETYSDPHPEMWGFLRFSGRESRPASVEMTRL